MSLLIMKNVSLQNIFYMVKFNMPSKESKSVYCGEFLNGLRQTSKPHYILNKVVNSRSHIRQHY